MEILGKAGADIYARITDTTSLTARIARPSTLTGRQGQTTLFYVAESGRTEVVKYLLAHGAKVDVVDDTGKSPIDVAAGNRGGEGQNRSSEICGPAQECRHDTLDTGVSHCLTLVPRVRGRRAVVCRSAKPARSSPPLADCVAP